MDRSRPSPLFRTGQLAAALTAWLACESVVFAQKAVDLRFHLLTDAEWKEVKAVEAGIRQDIKDAGSPLFRQRGRDVHGVAVRRPDRPWLLPVRGGVQLIPGDAHHETGGFANPGRYQAIAVEWSGLESEPSAALTLTAAAAASESIREIVHRYGGVIAREWYRKGVLTQRHDLNHEGKAIRRLSFEVGKISCRDYFNREGEHVSREVFAPDGSIAERIMMAKYGNTTGEADHWWFERGTPVRRVAGRTETLKEGDQWTQK